MLEVNVTTGTIKKVVADRGFGFIAAEDGHRCQVGHCIPWLSWRKTR